MNKFLEEILEQTTALNKTLKFYEGATGKDLMQKAINLHKNRAVTDILLTGMGSSFFSSYLASCLFNANGIRASAINASELLHYHFSLVQKNTMLVCVSQSGESYEVVEILNNLPEDIPCLAVTNEPESTLARMGSEILLSKAGREEMTSTKSYISIALVKIMFSWALSGQWTSQK